MKHLTPRRAGTSLAFACLMSAATGMHEARADQTARYALAPCPDRPNCVSTDTSDPGQRMAPLTFTGSAEAAQAALLTAIRALPRSTVSRNEPGRIVAEFRSRIFGFVDQAEFVIDAESGSIRFRSGARSGYWDLGVNRARMDELAHAFNQATLSAR
ncbi:MAG TPA: DUF1499 domain-containing protein [Methyloversatilis sp.]